MKTGSPVPRRSTLGQLPRLCLLGAFFLPGLPAAEAAQIEDSPQTSHAQPAADEQRFQQRIEPLLKKYCIRCHNADEMMSGVRVDQLNGTPEGRQLFLWKGIARQLEQQAMPPQDELQPTEAERRLWLDWIEQTLITARRRDTQKNGSIRRLTVAQYRNTLRDLLGIEDDLTDILPPDAVSRDGFLNNGRSMQLSPLLIEAYLDIAEKALDRCLVDPSTRPLIESFRMDLGKGINSEPCPDKLILGANSRLLENADFRVTQLTPSKPFAYEPLPIPTRYRFQEGYEGNATVRGWREYDSIYHAVFACMRGSFGYPKGNAYETVPAGLLLRPAIPSPEIFSESSTYGPHANFKISLRQLPDVGRFRVTVRAARYDDGLLLDPTDEPRHSALPEAARADQIEILQPAGTVSTEVARAGIYQIDVHLAAPKAPSINPDPSHLSEGLLGHWPLDSNLNGRAEDPRLAGALQGRARLVDSPFGKALRVDGKDSSMTVPRHELMNVGNSDFSVAAWIHPEQLRQGGIVCLGRYNYTHGWYFDMPNANGVLRIETMNADGERNGTVQTRPGLIRPKVWQHVAAVVRRGDNQTVLYINGIKVARGTIKPANLDNLQTTLHVGRIEGGNLFHGQIDDVRIYGRALEAAEIQALVEPGRSLIQPLPEEKPGQLALTLGERYFSGQLTQPAFLAVRIPEGPLTITARHAGSTAVGRVTLTRLSADDPIAMRFARFEQRNPRLGVHLGLRRDCGSTLARVGRPQDVTSDRLQEFRFEGAISNYPSPEVEKSNVNYLAGIREIGVRSEYTDGRDMPRLLIRSVEFEGPFLESWPPATHQRIVGDTLRDTSSPETAHQIIRTFATRAFRRPLQETEADSLCAVFDDAYADTNDLKGSLKQTLQVVLTSPQFLFLVEASLTPEAEPLGPYELASKLSYFLWNSAPDAELLELAAMNSLHRQLDEQVERLVNDPRFERFSHEFASQWLSLDKLDVVEIDRKRFPMLTRDTRAELRKEPVAFLQYLIRRNLPARNLIESEFLVVNEVVAGYYGLGQRTESGFEFVAIPRGSRHQGGVLTQPGILAGLSDGRESNPVKRGAWLARKIIAEPPDDPPPNVPALEEDTTQLTLRERLERHRDQPGCAKCHSGIDPWGLPFEEFSAGGLPKEPAPADLRSTLPDGSEVANLQDLRVYLARQREEQVAFSIMKHLAIYATGRDLSYNEIESLREAAVELKPTEYRLLDLIKFIVRSPIFLEK